MILQACDKSAHASSFLFDSEGSLTIFRDPSPGKPRPDAELRGSDERRARWGQPVDNSSSPKLSELTNSGKSGRNPDHSTTPPHVDNP